VIYFTKIQVSNGLVSLYFVYESISFFVQVVRWGRSVYANIQKFIQFQLTVNVAALVINVVAAITSGDVPLNAVQVRISSSLFFSHLHLHPNLCLDEVSNREEKKKKIIQVYKLKENKTEKICCLDNIKIRRNEEKFLCLFEWKIKCEKVEAWYKRFF